MAEGERRTLRVVDAGSVGPLRSQSLWHGIATAMRPGDRPTLSFCRPDAPYVSIGRHRSLAELDLERCRELGVPVLRRAIGGGPVWIDSDQLFFQLTVPAASAPARVDRLYARALAPAVSAFRALGLDAALSGLNDVACRGRRLSGTGAGRLGDGVTVVGNVIFRFPHARMVEVLALPGGRLRAECLRLMRLRVSSLEAEGRPEVGPGDARRILVAAYAGELGLAAERVAPTPREERAIDAWEARFGEPSWHRGPAAAETAGRKVKICAGVWVYEGERGDLAAGIAVADGRIERAWVSSPGWNGDGRTMETALAGRPGTAAALGASLAPFGERGESVARLLEPGLETP